MKVEMLRPTKVNGQTARPGDVVEVSGREARVLFHANKARPAREEATVSAPERAVQPESEPRGLDEEGSQEVEPSDELVELVGGGPAGSLGQAGYPSVEAGRQAIAGGVDLTAIDGVGPATVRKIEQYETATAPPPETATGPADEGSGEEGSEDEDADGESDPEGSEPAGESGEEESDEEGTEEESEE